MTNNTRRALVVALALPLIAVAVIVFLRELPRWGERAWTGIGTASVVQPGEKYPIARVEAGGPADRAGARRGDVVIALDGIPVTDVAPFRQRERALRVGDAFTLTVQRDGQEIDLSLVAESVLDQGNTRVRLFVGVFAALVFLATGLFVGLAKPDDRRARVLTWLMIFYSITYALLDVLMKSPLATGRIAEEDLVGLFLLVGTIGAFSTPLLLHLSLVFPRERPSLSASRAPLVWAYLPGLLAAILMTPLMVLVFLAIEAQAAGGEPPVVLTAIGAVLGAVGSLLRRPWAAAIACVVLVALPLWFFVHLVRVARRHGLAELARRPVAVIGLAVSALTFAGFSPLILALQFEDESARRGLGVAGGVILSAGTLVLFFGTFVAQLIATLIGLIKSYREAGAEDRRQIFWPLWALVLSLGVGSVLAGVAGVGGGPQAMSMLPLDILSKLLAITIPIAFAFAIFRYRLMDVDLVMRRTVAYLVLTGIVVAIYLGISAGLGAMLVSAAGVRGQWGTIVAALVAAAAFFPLRARVQRGIERTIFRERHDYPETLARFASEIASESNSARMAQLAAEAIQRELPNKAVVVILAIGDGRELRPVAKVGDIQEARLRHVRVDAGSALVQTLREPVDASAIATLGADRDLLATCLSVEVAGVRGASDRAHGLITLGRRTNLEAYAEIDREFIRGITSALGRRLDEVRLAVQSEDLDRARAIQASLLPHALPAIEGFEIGARYRPSQGVGGDYYDALLLDDGRLALAIADVSGKGMAAALLMSNAQAAFRALAGAGLPPARLVSQINRVLAGNVGEARFVTFSYLEIDPRTGAMRSTNAGHQPPAIVRRDGRVELLPVDGIPLGLFADSVYSESTATLEPGDVLFLLTDGISEAADPSGTFFGDDGFDARLRDAARGARSADDAAERLVGAAIEFASGEPRDDVTLLVARRAV